MHVKIQGGGDGVYANSGSCSAAAMYCEHERKELMDKGMKPETFFHQYSDFVSTREVIDRIDNNKKKLRKDDAKFFVMTVSPSADEQRKMGYSLDERIAAFKNYIRNGVMDEYAKNFDRGLSANDIMYYAYIHINRSDKTGEQMHAHIIISRRNMDNSISLSPKSNHRKGNGVIAHGFNRDQFNKSCERSFDNMMGYSRSVEDSYQYRNAVKNGDYQDIANVTAMAAERSYGVNLSDWDRLVKGELNSITTTEKPKYTEPVVSESVVPTQQTTNTGILGLAKKAWNFATGLFGSKKDEPKSNVSTQKLEQKFADSEMFVFKTGNSFRFVWTKGDVCRQSHNMSMEDVLKIIEIQKTGNKEEINKILAEMFEKYLDDIPEQKIEELKKRQDSGQEQKVEKTQMDGLRIFKMKDKEHYSAALYKNGKRVRFADKVDDKDVADYFKAKNSGDKDYLKKVSVDISAKYFHEYLARQVTQEFMQKNKEDKNENITFIRAQRGYQGYCNVRYKVDDMWRPGYKISDKLSYQINSLPEHEIPIVLGMINNMLANGLSISASGGCGISQTKDDNNKKKKKKGIGQ